MNISFSGFKIVFVYHILFVFLIFCFVQACAVNLQQINSVHMTNDENLAEGKTNVHSNSKTAQIINVYINYKLS